MALHTQLSREGKVEEMERIQIDQALEEGVSPTELARAGLTSAVPPKVL